MFPGITNNDMLRLFQEVKGTVSKKLIAQHYSGYDLLKKNYHFVDGFFLYEGVDEATGLPTILKKKYDMVKPERDLKKELLSQVRKNEDKKRVLDLCDLLLKCFTLDPMKRITADEAIQHPFFKRDSDIDLINK